MAHHQEAHYGTGLGEQVRTVVLGEHGHAIEAEGLGGGDERLARLVHRLEQLQHAPAVAGVACCALLVQVVDCAKL
eukprot:4367523-Alexandrium_andersonii.AAC.1